MLGLGRMMGGLGAALGVSLLMACVGEFYFPPGEGDGGEAMDGDGPFDGGEVMDGPAPADKAVGVDVPAWIDVPAWVDRTAAKYDVGLELPLAYDQAWATDMGVYEDIQSVIVPRDWPRQDIPPAQEDIRVVPPDMMPDIQADMAPDMLPGRGVYPSGPYGTRASQIIEDMDLLAANDAAYAYADPDENLYLHAFYDDTSIKGLYLVSISGWCSTCISIANELEEIYQEYKEEGMMFLGVLYEDQFYRPATREYVDQLADGRGWTFPGAADPEKKTFDYFPRNYANMAMIIDLRTMEIFSVSDEEASAYYIRRSLDRFLSQRP